MPNTKRRKIVLSHKKSYTSYQRPDDTAPYIPTPEEIQAGCAEVQETWESREERSRRKYDDDVSRFKLPKASDQLARREFNKIDSY